MRMITLRHFCLFFGVMTITPSFTRRDGKLAVEPRTIVYIYNIYLPVFHERCHLKRIGLIWVRFPQS